MKKFVLILYALVLSVPAHAQVKPLKVVQQERARFGTVISPAQAPELLKNIAIQMAKTQGGSWGRLVKKAGNSCGGYSCDRICDGQFSYDVLIDGPDATVNYSGPSKPNWPAGTKLNGATCDFVIMAQPPPSPEPDLAQVYEVIDRLAARVTAVEQQLHDDTFVQRLANDIAVAQGDLVVLKTQQAALDGRVQTLESRPFPCTYGRVFGVFGVRSCPEKQPEK